eukprot:CAMPEP_0171141058 /NCGR_PEP_ID=MMETSP0766_2-20121228/139938_1 /TAXON_ID=439317 /ORGANISM="Gambierdiscus australes, Strain CAWD 149" /LENGTH=168 /DNA_ID=CAMNT_0011604773 /DNA_START=8 /DNA_END=510 /DNA_ORIENTATION=+
MAVLTPGASEAQPCHTAFSATQPLARVAAPCTGPTPPDCGGKLAARSSVAPPMQEAVPLPLPLLLPKSDSGLPKRKRALRAVPPVVTTAVVRNIPRDYSQEDLLGEWVPNGTFNYLHMPQKNSMEPFGYAFVNFVSPQCLVSFQERWHGRYLSKRSFNKPLDVAIAKA